MATEIASQHPAETWQILTGALAGVIALTGVVYNRLNKDIDYGDRRQEDYQKQTDSRLNNLSREQEGISTNVQAILKDVEEIFRKLSAGAESFSGVREHLKGLETRLDAILRELEQKSGAHVEASRELKEDIKKLKEVIDSIDKRCFGNHPGQR